MIMSKLALVVACLAFGGHGRRAQASGNPLKAVDDVGGSVAYNPPQVPMRVFFVAEARQPGLRSPFTAMSDAASLKETRVASVQTHAADKVVVSPSVAKADFWDLGTDLQAAVDAGAEWLHFSVQDGRMVPKVSLGSPVISACREKLPHTVFDVKLGVINPEDRISEFAKAGADIISVHPEATPQLGAVINLIKKAGCAAGVVINPGTSISLVEPLLEDIDVVVIMLVNPGWGGPKYMAAAVDKICALKKISAERGLNPWIEVDGGVSSKNVAELVGAGANALVAGGSIFTSDDKKKAIEDLVNAK